VARISDARGYLGAFSWCRAIREAHFGCGVGGVVAVFLFGIDGDPGVDEWLWVVSGDLPSACFVVDRAPDALSALSVYCELVNAWVAAVRGNGDLADAFPVRAEPTEENAGALAFRIELLRSEIVPALRP
jgi:hypothetical protein